MSQVKLSVIRLNLDVVCALYTKYFYQDCLSNGNTKTVLFLYMDQELQMLVC